MDLPRDTRRLLAAGASCTVLRLGPQRVLQTGVIRVMVYRWLGDRWGARTQLWPLCQ